MRNTNIIGEEVSLGFFFIFTCAFFMVTFVPFSDFLGEGEIVYTTVKVPKDK